MIIQQDKNCWDVPKDKEDITGYIYESWHYRYVGKKIAKYIHEHDITFEEYYAKYKQIQSLIDRLHVLKHYKSVSNHQYDKYL